MQLDNVDVSASPHFSQATCPKHRRDMIEIPNGWFSVCWYCEECKYPYQLVMQKMRNVDQENLRAALIRAKEKRP
jgi:hypothetical protein